MEPYLTNGAERLGTMQWRFFLHFVAIRNSIEVAYAVNRWMEASHAKKRLKKPCQNNMHLPHHIDAMVSQMVFSNMSPHTMLLVLFRYSTWKVICLEPKNSRSKMRGQKLYKCWVQSFGRVRFPIHIVQGDHNRTGGIIRKGTDNCKRVISLFSTMKLH